MKKIVIVLICVFLITGITACTSANQTSPSATIVNPPTQTVTVTSIITPPAVTSAPTTVTAPAQTITTTVMVTTTPSPSTTLTPTPSPALTVNFDSFNNSSFYLSSFTSATKTTLDPNGTVVSTPVNTDIFGDLPLGGFVTDKKAILAPKIPSVTTHDDWIYRFNFPVYDFPFLINMGYKLNPASPNAKVDFYVLTKEVFNNTYEKTPLNLYTVDLAKTPTGVSNEGISSYKINATGDLVVVFRTANADDVEGWWFKYGGKHY
jgi:hypothetical protein